MANFENSRRTFSAAALIPADSLVKLTADGVQPCGAGELPLGVTETGARMADAPVAVRMLNTPGSVEVIASAAVTIGQTLTSGAAGSVVPHSGVNPVVGLALTAAASGGVVEMMPTFVPHISA